MELQIMQEICQLKNELQKEGFIIDAIFGSVARDEATSSSDIDLLYHIDEKFLEKYQGFRSFKRLEEIKNYLKKRLKRNVDLAPIDNLSQTAKKHIFKEALFVS